MARLASGWSLRRGLLLGLTILSLLTAVFWVDRCRPGAWMPGTFFIPLGHETYNGQYKHEAHVWHGFGCEFESAGDSAPFVLKVIAIPGWCAFAVISAYPLYELLRACRRACVRRIRLRHGRCIVCGFDLTGNVSGRCPECDAVVHAQRMPHHDR